MKTIELKLAMIFTLLFITASLSVPSVAQTASPRTTVVNLRFNGIEARAGSQTQTDCVITVLDVFANLGPGTDNVSGRPSGPLAILYTGAVNFCTGQVLFNENGSVDLSPGQFTVDSSLSSAALKVTIPVFDRVSGNSVNVDVDLNWTATSNPQVLQGTFFEKYPDGTEQFTHTNGTFREAVATGTIGGINVTTDPIEGSIQSVREGDLTLTRPQRAPSH